MTRDFRVVDVFSRQPFLGNPVAVVLNADGLSDDAMQRIAAWTNLSETTFHLAPSDPGADYRLRIFTPRSELPFAGHPTLGSAHALLEAGLVTANAGHLVQECGVGLVPIAVEGSGEARALRLQLPVPKLRDLTEEEQARLIAVLGVPLSVGTRAALVDVGARWVVGKLDSAQTLLGLTPDLAASALFETDLGVTGITLYAPQARGNSQIEVRSFAPSCGVNEDPVCGSGNGSVAAYRLARRETSEGSTYRAAQGRCVGRDGLVSIKYDGGRIYVGGQVVTTIEGRITASLPLSP